MAGSEDGLQDSYSISSWLNTEIAINDIVSYLKEVNGGGERADGKTVNPLDGKMPSDSDNYILYDPSDDSGELWLGGIKRWEWNKP